MLSSSISLGVTIKPQVKSVITGVVLYSRGCYPKIFVRFSKIHRFRTLKLTLAAIQLVRALYHQRCFYEYSKCISTLTSNINPLNPELNPICYLLALLAHHFLHVSRIRVKSLTIRLLMSYIYIYICIYMEHLFWMFLDHTQRRTTVGRTPLDE